MEIINATDGYKLGHHRMYPEGTQMVYSNWTPRSCRYFPEATEGSVVFGIQYFVKKYLIEEFNKWFALPKEEAIKQFAYRVGNFVDLNQVGTKHIEELYDLGYLPIEIKALPEGSICPIRVPMMTIKNTLPDFFQLTLKKALLDLKDFCKNNEITEIGIPYKLGCGLAGGDWDGVVYPMLQELFANDSTITLYIYKLCNN